jgi:hypothetical protein
MAEETMAEEEGILIGSPGKLVLGSCLNCRERLLREVF